MSENVNRNREILKEWCGVFNTGDWDKIKPALMELTTKDYLLHDPSVPKGVQTFAEFAVSFERNFMNKRDYKITLEDCIGEDDKLASRCMIEWIDPNSNEKKKVLLIVISRFEGDKVAEEWQVTAPVA